MSVLVKTSVPPKTTWKPGKYHNMMCWSVTLSNVAIYNLLYTIC